jgi:hypothetical protein
MKLMEFLRKYLPACLTEDEEWVDLSMFSGTFGSEGDIEKETLLHPL